MNTGIFTGAGKALFPWLCIMNLFLIICPMMTQADVSSMRNYCDAPPVDGFKPNLLLMMDNSASMYDLAYTNPSTYCIDDSIDTFEKAGTRYTGYFDPSKLYSYNFTNSDFETASSQTMPTAPCSAAQTSYLCANVTSGKLDNLLASGNFLNWLTTSKLDIEKKALTGGNYDPTHQWLQSETRGCQGKGFIKMVGNSPVTFAVRGPLPGESDYVYRASYGGFTKIDVYASRYNKDPCLAAVKAWQDGVAASFTAAAQACLNNQYDPPPHSTTPSKGNVFTQIMSDCYLHLAQGTPLSADIALENACRSRYLVYYPQPALIPASAGDEVCGANLQHNGGYSSEGFLGSCYPVNKWNSSCVVSQMTDFCNEMVTPTLTDPSASTLMTGTNANLPGFILDAGITNLGAVSGTVRARVATGAAPTGLIQEFSSVINFGAMVFNDSGAGSECSSQKGSAIPCVKHCQKDPAPQNECYQDIDCASHTSCVQDSLSDGGRIISYVNHTPLGDHTPGSGLIASIDAVAANSWTPLAETFYDAIGYFANRTDLRLQAADFDATWPPRQFACQRNNILIVTDGMSTADRAEVVNSYVANGLSGYTADASKGMPALQTTKIGDLASAAPPFQGSYNLDDLAWIARNTNITNTGAPIRNLSDYLSSYVVYTGPPCGAYDANGNCTTSDEGVPEKMMQLVALKGGGKIANAQNPADLETALRGMLAQIGTNSGTGASILSTGDSNGAIFLQEQFYPNKSFDGGVTWASWIGEMQSLWYYIDPFIGSTGGASTIREDTGAKLTLDLKKDRVVQYSFNGQNTQANLYLDADGDGNVDPAQPAGYPQAVSPDAVQSLWRAGLQLWKRDPATRTIYTQTDGQNLTGLSASDANQQQFLQASDPTDAGNIVSFVQGTDSPSTRNRSVYADATGTKKVWKLGDIISSTPALQSVTSLGSYNIPAPQGYGDLSYQNFINSIAYQKRGTVYVGANDGMLHAFRLGSLQLQRDASWSSSQKATLTGTELGKEEWAFVPRNALPYLRYPMDPNYSHLHFVDGSITLADASLGNPANCDRNSYWNCPEVYGKGTRDEDTQGTNWHTVLIGGMGLGGASKGAGDTCSEGASGTCIKAPLPTVGLSSYFALDVTGQKNDGTGPPPTLLWEFSPPGLGFATSGAAIVKLNARTGADLATHDSSKNGRWFAVFASGPTGSIDCSSCQFQGKSDQNLKLFVVDLNAVPPLTQGGNYWVIDTGIPSAFGGNMSGAGIDTDRWNMSASGFYEDNALYLGYTGKAGDGTWTNGGVLRLLTRENPDPSQWVTSKVIDGIGPVTGAVSRLQDRGNHSLWLYFGTGRYFFNQDDMPAGRSLFGVKEPCYVGMAGGMVVDSLPEDNVSVTACSTRTPLTLSDLSNMTDSTSPGPGAHGWWIGLDAAAGTFGSERLTANPAALTGGAVSFTSFKPSSVPCQQGASYLWVVKYDSGGSAAFLNGKAIVPLSNGSSAELSLANWTDRGGRRGAQMTGKPGGVKLITNSGLKPLKKIIHIQER